MRISKARAERLLSVVTDELQDAKEEAKNAICKVEYLRCAKAYLEFIIQGIKKNPSMKIPKEKEEDESE